MDQRRAQLAAAASLSPDDLAPYAENGGLLYGTLTLTHNGAYAHGPVTGGTGPFEGATGTITAKPANASGTHSAVTITYTR